MTQPNPLKIKILDPLPTQPNPWVNPTHGQLWAAQVDLLTYLKDTSVSSEKTPDLTCENVGNEVGLDVGSSVVTEQSGYKQGGDAAERQEEGEAETTEQREIESHFDMHWFGQLHSLQDEQVQSWRHGKCIIMRPSIGDRIKCCNPSVCLSVRPSVLPIFSK